MGYEMMGGAGHMAGWAGMAAGGVMMLLWFALLAAVIVLVVRWLGGPSRQSPAERGPGQDALETLRQRFARGDIDAAEFEARARVLRGPE